MPHVLSVVNTYTKVTTRSKQVAVVVKILMVIPITITKGVKVTQVVAANAMPKVEVVPRTLEKLYEMQGIQQTRMSVQQRREVLFQQLDLSGLEGWSNKDQAAAHTLLAEYHDISLEPGELGYTDLAKQKIKERFQGIPSPMEDEVQAQVKEMLEAGAIHLSKSPWCNTVVLVHKKDGGLCFCIDFCPICFPRHRKPLKA